MYYCLLRSAPPADRSAPGWVGAEEVDVVRAFLCITVGTQYSLSNVSQETCPTVSACGPTLGA